MEGSAALVQSSQIENAASESVRDVKYRSAIGRRMAPSRCVPEHALE